MRNISQEKMGGIGALLVALFAGLFATMLLLTPLAVRQAEVMSWAYVLSDYVLALAGLFGLAAVPAIHQRIAPLSEGWMRWTSTLALIGFALMAVNGFWQAGYETSVVEFLVHSPFEEPLEDVIPETAQGAFLGLLGRVPVSWFEAAGIGLWVFSVSWLARGTGLLPKSLIYTGLSAGVLSIAATLGAAPQMALLLLPIIMTGGLLLSTLWFFRMGRLLLREERTARSGPFEEKEAYWKTYWSETIDALP